MAHALTLLRRAGRAAGLLLLACLLALGGLRAALQWVWPTAHVLTVYTMYQNGPQGPQWSTIAHHDPARRHSVAWLPRAFLGRAYTLAWSPDGRTLAYAEAAGVSEALALYHPATGTATRLPLSGPSLVGAAWSPNGTWLATTLTDDEGLPRVFAFPLRQGADGARPGGPAQVLFEDAAQPVWSPDGTQLAVRDRLGRLVLITTATGERRLLNWVVDDVLWAPGGDALLLLEALEQRVLWLPLTGLPDAPVPLATFEGARWLSFVGLMPGRPTVSVLLNLALVCHVPLPPAPPAPPDCAALAPPQVWSARWRSLP